MQKSVSGISSISKSINLFTKSAPLSQSGTQWSFNLRSSFLTDSTRARRGSKPSNIKLSNSSINENISVGSFVGKLTTVDRYQKNKFKYRLISISGNQDHTAFRIVRDQLRINVSPDFEQQSSYKLKVRTTDRNGLSRDKVFTISVNNLPDVVPDGTGSGGGTDGGTGGGGGTSGTTITGAEFTRQDLAKVVRVSQWESNMRNRALQIYSVLTDPNTTQDEKLAATYYDGEKVFLEISEYLNDPKYRAYAQAAGDIYQKYVLDNNGFVPGYWNFTDGLTKRYLETKDPDAKKAVQLLATNAAYARDSTPLQETQSHELSREVSTAIQAYLNAELVGEPRRWRLSDLIDHALGHLDQWFVTKSASDVKPFMVGLTAEALIDYQEQVGGDNRIVPALIQALDSLWQSHWDANAQAFRYKNYPTPQEPDISPAPDLNLMIAPAYAWLYLQTGEARFKQRGDLIFDGGVKGAWLGGGKQFNQNYQWSTDYIEWRIKGENKW